MASIQLLSSAIAADVIGGLRTLGVVSSWFTYAELLDLLLKGVDDFLDDVYSLEYVWVVLAAGTIVAITMVNIRIHGVKGPGEW
ncbi:hypothetical protein AB0O95_06145 [Rhodoglobus sp. NPDC076762]